MGFGKILIAVCPGVALNRWFSRHYAIALAITMSGFHLGGLLPARMASRKEILTALREV